MAAWLGGAGGGAQTAMYRACLFCHGRLGVNDVVPTFPVGSRLAFDTVRGRFWVVCPACHRWNLAPLEERWEAIEECERRFRATRLRYSNGTIGLADLPQGLTLIRIGPALAPELAAWRYGRHLLRRLSAAPGAVRDLARGMGDRADRVTRAALARLGVRSRADLRTALRLYRRPNRVVTVAELGAGGRAVIRMRHLAASELVRPDPLEPWQLEVAHDGGRAVLAGDRGLRTAGKLFAALNGAGASDRDVQYALAKLDDAANPQGYFARVAAIALRCWWGRRPDAAGPSDPGSPAETPTERVALHLTKRSFWGRGGLGSEPRTRLPELPLVDRLALEMAANEDTERRALEGELWVLELAWRQAEEIAAIADRLPCDAVPAFA